jgi:AraC-like DNA-binding protein
MTEDLDTMSPKPLFQRQIYQHLVQAKLFMDQHYDSGINLDRIAACAFFSKFHFIRVFRSVYGKTPNQYLASVRIEQAKERLKNGSTIADACWQVGFHSLGSFKVLFKQMTHLTPGAYQKKQMDLKNAMNASPDKFIPGCLLRKKSNFQDRPR